MENYKETWYKWDYVCSSCDAHVEITSLVDGKSIKSESCMKCLSPLTLVSVVDATINPIENPAQLKKEDKMNLDALVKHPQLADQIKQEYDLRYGNEITELKNQLSAEKGKHVNCDYWKSENGRIQSQLIALVDNFYENEYTDDSGTIEKICEIIDYQPTKEIEYTATIEIRGTMSVPMSDYNDNFDIGENLSFNIDPAFDSYDMIIDSYEVSDAREF